MNNTKIRFLFVLLSAFSFLNLYSQVKDSDFINYSRPKNFSIKAYGTYISSAAIQHNPFSSDPFFAGFETELDGAYGYGAELNFEPKFGDANLIFYISTEYYHLKQSNIPVRLESDTTIKTFRTTENITMYPIEGGVKWTLPVGFEKFKLYIGGGGGVYFGSRTQTIINLESKIIDKKPGFSINVLAGVDYQLTSSISIDTELKFREATFDVNSEYNTNGITIDGNTYRIETPFYSRVNVNGLRISAGLKFHF